MRRRPMYVFAYHGSNLKLLLHLPQSHLDKPLTNPHHQNHQEKVGLRQQSVDGFFMPCGRRHDVVG